MHNKSIAPSFPSTSGSTSKQLDGAEEESIVATKRRRIEPTQASENAAEQRPSPRPPRLPDELISNILGHLWTQTDSFEEDTAPLLAMRLVSPVWRRATDHLPGFRKVCAYKSLWLIPEFFRNAENEGQKISPSLNFALKHTSSFHATLKTYRGNGVLANYKQTQRCYEILKVTRRLEKFSLSSPAVENFFWSSSCPWSHLAGIRRLLLSDPLYPVESTIGSSTTVGRIAKALEDTRKSETHKNMFVGLKKLKLENLTASAEQAKSLASLLRLLPNLQFLGLYDYNRHSPNVNANNLAWLPWDEMTLLKSLRIRSAYLTDDAESSFKKKLLTKGSIFYERQMKTESLALHGSEFFVNSEYDRRTLIQFLSCFTSVKDLTIVGGLKRLGLAEVSWQDLDKLESLILSGNTEYGEEAFLEGHADAMLRSLPKNLARLSIEFGSIDYTDEESSRADSMQPRCLDSLARCSNLVELKLFRIVPDALAGVRGMQRLQKLYLSFEVGPLKPIFDNLDLSAMKNLRSVSLHVPQFDASMNRRSPYESKSTLVSALQAMLDRSHPSIMQVAFETTLNYTTERLEKIDDHSLKDWRFYCRDNITAKDWFTYENTTAHFHALRRQNTDVKFTCASLHRVESK